MLYVDQSLQLYIGKLNVKAELTTPFSLFACALDGQLNIRVGEEGAFTTDFLLCEAGVKRDIEIDGIYAYLYFEPGHPYFLALERKANSHLYGLHFDADETQNLKGFFIDLLKKRPPIEEMMTALDEAMTVDDSFAFYTRTLDKRVQQVMDIIKRRPTLNHSVEGLAAEVFLSPSRLMGLFKEQTSITLGHYMAMRKTINAYALYFKLGRLRDAALRAGFYDEAHFSKTSKKLLGILPSSLESEHVVTELITNLKV